MMNEDMGGDDDSENEHTILDRESLMHPIDQTDFVFNQFNIGIYDNSNNYSKGKTAILAVTCISIGMFTGLLGPIFPRVAENMSTELSSSIWLIFVKGIGFLIGTYLSSYLYAWFNALFLLGLSCLSISFGVCSLPFINDLATFYLTALILGFGLSLSYNGIDALYNHIWTGPSLSSIRWLHLLVALGAILSTLMLLPSTFTTDNNTNLLQENHTRISIRPPRAVLQPTTSKSICIKLFCCYDQNNRTNIFTCQENQSNQSNYCISVISSCQTSEINECIVNKNNVRCRIDRICENETKPICLVDSIDLVLTTTDSTQSTKHHRKPPTAESNNDDLSKNFFYSKIRSFIHSITWIDVLYLLLSMSFFFLGISYSLLAMLGEQVDVFSMINPNPLSLLFIQPHRIIKNPTRQVSLLSDYSSLKFVFLLVVFYFILSGIENSCFYLSYLFGIKLKLTTRQCLLFQFFYLLGRLIDILINYIWFLVNKYLKKESDFISIKLLIFTRLIALTIISFSNLLQPIYYLLFFAVGLLLTSISSLILYWIERDLSLNETLLRIILFTIIISESVIPFLFSYRIEYYLQLYIFIGLCLLILLFIMMLYTSRKWQRNRSYRLLPTSMESGDMELEEHSDNETSNSSKFN